MNYYTRYSGPIVVHSRFPGGSIADISSIECKTGRYWNPLQYHTKIDEFNRSLSQNKVSELCVKKKWSF